MGDGKSWRVAILTDWRIAILCITPWEFVSRSKLCERCMLTPRLFPISSNRRLRSVITIWLIMVWLGCMFHESHLIRMIDKSMYEYIAYRC